MDTSKIQIRLAVADDLADIKTCASQAYSRYIERMGREPAPMIANFARQIKLGQVRVATVDSMFAGYVVFYNENNHLHLESVAVTPELAGKGLGKGLIEYVEKTALEKGFDAVELYTNEVMTENLAIYPKLGYVETERKVQNGFKRVFFRKLL